MKLITPPKDLPRLIYGTAWKKDETARLVVMAVKAGFRGIDTACQPKHYAEAEVGKALQELKSLGFSRDDLYIQTKFTPVEGQDPKNIPYDKDALLAQQVAQSFEVSLKNLQSDYVDTLILHSPLFPFSKLLEVWQAMETIVLDQKTHRLGISNCYDLDLLQRLYDTATIKPSILQNRFYDDTGYDKELRAWCDKHAIIYESFWTLTANPHILANPIILDLASKYAKMPAGVLFRYLTQKGIVPLTGTHSLEHMQEDLSIFEFQLLSFELEQIDALLN